MWRGPRHRPPNPPLLLPTVGSCVINVGVPPYMRAGADAPRAGKGRWRSGTLKGTGSWGVHEAWGRLGVAHPASGVLGDVPERVGTSSCRHGARGGHEDARQDGGLRLGDEPAVSGGLGVARPASGVPGGAPKRAGTPSCWTHTVVARTSDGVEGCGQATSPQPGWALASWRSVQALAVRSARVWTWGA